MGDLEGMDIYERDQEYTRLSVYVRLLEDAVADSVYTSASLPQDDISKVVTGLLHLLEAIKPCRWLIVQEREDDGFVDAIIRAGQAAGCSLVPTEIEDPYRP